MNMIIIKKILSGGFIETGNIVFDDEVVVVHRDYRAFWYSIFVVFFIISGPVLRQIGGSPSINDSMFFYDITVSIAALALFVFSINKLIEIRKTTNISFAIQDLKAVTIESRRNKYIRIELQLNDFRKTSVTVQNDIYFNDFIDTLRRQNIPIL